jgi:membrane protein implicated in regulation of membrane protease activity
MALVVGVLLAIFVVDGRWEWAVIAGGGAIEFGEAWFWWRLSHRRRPAVGAEALVGRTADVVSADWVRVHGELWRARGAARLEPGAQVRVLAIEGLTLVVEPLTGDGVAEQRA